MIHIFLQEDASYHSIREVLTFMQPPVSEHVSNSMLSTNEMSKYLQHALS